MLPKKITQIILYGVGLGSLAAVVYFAGPFIAIGNWHPLENTIVRSIIILLLVAGAARLRSRSRMASAVPNRRSTTSLCSRSA